jgi:RNA polymerase sigma-70 factor (ECF subfamily)
MESVEHQLIRAARRGDSRAFGDLIRMYDKRTLQIAYGITGNMADAQDAFQDGVAKAWSQLSAFRGESSFGTWMTRIVINEALNLKKKGSWMRQVSIDEPDSPELEAPYSTLQAPDSAMEWTHVGDRISDSMRLLSDRERTVFVLKHMHGYKLREIASMIDCAEGTVKNYLFRATQKMRDALTDLDYAS